MCEDMGNTLPAPTDGEPMPWRTQTVKENNAQNSLPSPVSQMPTSANSRAAAASAARSSKWLNRDDMDDRPKNSPKRTPHTTKAAANTPRELCRKCAKTHITNSLQEPQRSRTVSQKTTQKPHNNILFSWKTNI